MGQTREGWALTQWLLCLREGEGEPRGRQTKARWASRMKSEGKTWNADPWQPAKVPWIPHHSLMWCEPNKVLSLERQKILLLSITWHWHWLRVPRTVRGLTTVLNPLVCVFFCHGAPRKVIKNKQTHQPDSRVTFKQLEGCTIKTTVEQTAQSLSVNSGF